MNVTFGERLKEIRECKGWTHQQFADLIGCNRASYSNYEKGSRHPDSRVIKLICQIANVSSDYLLGLSDTKIPSYSKIHTATQLSEKSIKYLEHYSKTETPLGVGFKNQVIDFIIQEADQSEVFKSENPEPLNATCSGLDQYPKAPSSAGYVNDKEPENILEAIQEDWNSYIYELAAFYYPEEYNNIYNDITMTRNIIKKWMNSKN